MNKNTLRKKWERWITEIRPDIEKLLRNKYFFDEFLHVINTNQEIQHNKFPLWIKGIYTTSQMAGVRRLLDVSMSHRKRNQYSLLRLLLDISESLNKDPDIVNVNWYKRRHKYQWASSDFKEWTNGQTRLSITEVKKDIKSLKKLGNQIEKLATAIIAHTLIKSKIPKNKPTYNDLNLVIQEIEKVLIRYVGIFSGTGFTSLHSRPQDDWQKIFYIPWVKRKES